jgi:hypothetical protein
MTRYLRFGFVVTLVALGSFSVAQEPAHVIVRPDNVTWGPASPKLPAGAKFAKCPATRRSLAHRTCSAPNSPTVTAFHCTGIRWMST